jgi:actin
MSHIVCLDNGTSEVKIGFGGEEAPRAIVPNMTGTTKQASILVGTGNKKNYIGPEAIARKGTLHLQSPMSHGNVIDWDAMEQVWKYAYMNELKISPEEHPVLMTFNQSNVTNNEKTLELFFEKFQVPALYIGVQSLYSLYGSGRVSGLVVDVGDGVVSTLPIFDGQYLRHARTRVDLGGRDITEYLATLLLLRGVNLTNPTELELVKLIKHKYCFVSESYDEDMKKAQDSSAFDSTFILPDGRELKFSEERFKATEILFNPGMIGLESDGIHENVSLSIRRSDIDLRKTLCENIVPVGGTTLLGGFDNRLTQELINIVPGNMKVKVVTPDSRHYLPWIGMSIYAALNGLSTHSLWITKEDYEENGAVELVEKRVTL